MQNSQLPAKWYKPFAADDAAKVEIPVTTADPTRASQSLGFPPLTMQPPESGGVPPQGEDFNGAMNQVARIVWWMLGGGALPFDSVWATNANIGGYPQGASVVSADLLGEWLSTSDNNTNNPDTVGTGWVPGYAYGVTGVTGLTNANVTLTPAQAAKGIITLAGTLTGNVQIVFPNWLKNWLVVNNTTGAFSLTCKTAAGSGVVISQAGGAQIVWGDGTNLLAAAGNASTPLLVGPAALPAQAVQLSQVGQHFAVITANGNFVVPAGVYSLDAEVWGGGGGGGGVGSPSNGSAGGGGGGGYSRAIIAVTPGQTIAAVIGSGGAAGSAGGTGGTGGTTTFGALTATGGAGGSPNGTGTGGAGGTGSGGTLNVTGANGSGGLPASTSGPGGPGGAASFGGGGGGSAIGTASGGAIPGGGGGGTGSSIVQAGSLGARGQVNIRY